jgi:hypothetical protein
VVKVIGFASENDPVCVIGETTLESVFCGEIFVIAGWAAYAGVGPALAGAQIPIAKATLKKMHRTKRIRPLKCPVDPTMFFLTQSLRLAHSTVSDIPVRISP